MKAAFLFWAHALIIVMARVNSDPKNALYRQGKCMEKPVKDLSKASSVDLSNGGELKNLNSFRSTFRTKKLLFSMD